jgi:uncharacterized RDD family membrane protein YckC
MAEEIKLAETSAPPPLPDLPKPSLLPPTIPVVSPPPPPPVTSAPPVRMGALTAEETPEVGGALAPFNTRMSAAIIDIVISAGLCLAVSMVLPGFMGRMATLIGMAYLVTRDSLPFLGGQSVGKKAMHLRAVTLEGKPLTGNWEAGLIRSGVLLIPLFGLVELFVLLTREGKLEQGRRLGDEWAKTKVIIVPAVEG